MESGLMQELERNFKSELDELDTELRVHLPKEIKRALEFGDLRENSEYQTALQSKPWCRREFASCASAMSEVASIDLSKLPRDKASYGSTLVLYDASKDEEVTYRLVTPEESGFRPPVGSQRSRRLAAA